MIRRGAIMAWLLLVWLALAGSLTPAGLITGALLCAGLLVLFRLRPSAYAEAVVRPLGVLRFAVYFFARLVVANLQVARAVLRRYPNRTNRGIVAVPVMTSSDLVMTLLANAITLTPGTYVLDSQRNPATLYVHVLELSSVEAVWLSTLEMERQLVRALGTADALASIEARIAELRSAADRAGNEAR